MKRQHPSGYGAKLVDRLAGLKQLMAWSLAVGMAWGGQVMADDPAFDHASDPVYADGGNFEGLGGGTGFDTWINNPPANDDVAGLFIGDSNGNGGGNGPGINSVGDVAFGLYANSGALTEAYRIFYAYLLDGQTFSIDFDTGWIDGEFASQGFALQDEEGNNRVEMLFRSGSASYLINDGDNEFDTGIPFTDGGLSVAITVTSIDSYDISITELAGGTTTTFTDRPMGGVPGMRIDRLRVFNFNDAAGGPERDLYVNSLAIGCGASDCSVALADGDASPCPGQQLVYNGPDGADTYAWTIENNTSGAFVEGLDNQQSVVVNSGDQFGSFDLVLTTTASGCDAVCSVTVNVQGTPAPVADNNGPLCEGDDLILTATPIENATYTWVGPDFFTSGDQNPIVISATLAAAGEYSVSASVNGCPSEIATTLVEINPAPECLISGDEVICPGAEEVIYFAPDDQVYYQWSIEGDAELSTGNEGGFVRVIPAESGSYTLTLVIRDNNGCEVTCVKNVTIGDVEPPELTCPEELFVSPGTDTSPDAIGYPDMADFCDPSPTLTYEDIVEEGECAGSSRILRIWMAVDAAGNESSCEQIINVQDVEPPALEVPGETYIDCSEDTSPDNLGYATATDDSGADPVVTYADEVYPIDCANQYLIERLWTAVDACGNVSEAFQVIIVDDYGTPDMVVPASVAIREGDDASPDALGYATATDNCEGEVAISFFDEVVEGNCPSQYTINRYWFADDPCGNQAEGLQVITVGGGAIDLTVPEDAVASCGGDMSPEALGQAVALNAFGEAVEASYSDEIIPADCGGRYIVLRTWSAADECGVATEGVQTIVVDDTTAPELTMPEDATVTCGGDTSVEALGSATASDICDAEPVVSYVDEVVDPVCGGGFTILRTWSAIDQCGNVSESVQTILVRDQSAPELTIPADAAVACGADTSPDALGLATAADLCDPEAVVTFEDSVTEGVCASSYTITRTWTATDACGNSASAVQTIAVSDEEAPALVVPADIAVGCGLSTDPENTGSATASDSCSEPVELSYSDDVVDGVIVRTWTAIDACGNTAQADQLITASADEDAPSLSIPADAVVGCLEDVSVEALGLATASDNCDAAPVVGFSDAVIDGACEGSYTIQRTWTATDASGNAADAVQTITVQDDEAPVLTVPADVAVGCGASTDPENTGSATAEDACSGIASLTYADELDGTTILRTWTAVDGCGNSVSAVQSISTTGGSGSAPVITSPGDQTVVVQCGQPVNFAVPTASSDCDPNVSVVVTPPSGSLLGAGTHVITATATDSGGNSSTVTYNVTVLTPLRLAFVSPLKDDNVANNIETDADVVNKFKSGSTVPHKIKLYDCNGNDVTAQMASLVNVKLDVSLRLQTAPGQSLELIDMWELYNGVGGPNGKMVYQGGMFQFNLRTLLYPPNTINMPWFFRSLVTVEYKSSPGVVVGREDALLESQF